MNKCCHFDCDDDVVTAVNPFKEVQDTDFYKDEI